MQTPRPTTRRHFITGRSVVQAVDDALPSSEAVDSANVSVVSHSYLLRYSHRAMAADFQLFLIAGADGRGPEAALASFERIDQIESRLTVYRESSDVIDINRRASRESVAVDAELFALLKRAEALHRETCGAYDITSGPLSKAWGFARRQGAIPNDEALAEARACVGAENVVLDDAAQTVRFLRPGVEINFNSIGKGYALDQCAEVMRQCGVENYLWHGGQSSLLAHGDEGSGGEPSGGWTIGVGHPFRSDRRLAEISLRDQAAGTSGAGFQFFRHQGRRYGHILDPRTGVPAQGVFSVTVLAPWAAEADALSTAFYVLGFDAAVQFCERRPEISFLMLLPSQGGSAIELATYGLDDRQWRVV